MNPLSFIEPYVTGHYERFLSEGISSKIIIHPEEYGRWQIALEAGEVPSASWGRFWEKVDINDIAIPDEATLCWMLDDVARHAWLQPYLRAFCHHAAEQNKTSFVKLLNSVSIPHVMTLHFIMDDADRDQYLLTAKLLKNKSINTSQILKYIRPTAACWNHLPALNGFLNHMFNVAVTNDVRDYFKVLYDALKPELKNQILQTLIELDEKRFYEVGQNFSYFLLSSYYYARLEFWRENPKELVQESKQSMNFGFKAGYLTALLMYYREHSDKTPDLQELSNAVRFLFLLEKHKKTSFEGLKKQVKEWFKGHNVDVDIIYQQLSALGETIDVDVMVKLARESFQAQHVTMEIDMSILGLGDE